MPLHENIFLIGYMKYQIMGNKLPTRENCLKVLMYNMRLTKLSLNKSVTLVIYKCLVFCKIYTYAYYYGHHIYFCRTVIVFRTMFYCPE